MYTQGVVCWISRAPRWRYVSRRPGGPIPLSFALQRPCASSRRGRRRPGASPPGDCNAKPDHHTGIWPPQMGSAYAYVYVKTQQLKHARSTSHVALRITDTPGTRLRLSDPASGEGPGEARAGGRAHKRRASLTAEDNHRDSGGVSVSLRRVRGWSEL